MSLSWVPPRRSYHLRIFGSSLVLVLLCLVGLLFGVEMEAVAPATGVIVARDQRDLRALVGGLIEPGWYEGTSMRRNGESVRARLDGQGDGRAASAGTVAQFQMPAADQVVRFDRDAIQFHRLEPGDVLWPGQVVAVVRADDLRIQLAECEEKLKAREDGGESGSALDSLRGQRDRLRHRLAQAALRAPDGTDRWLVLAVHVAPFQAVAPGDLVATIVPLDPETGGPRDLTALLDMEEKHFGDVASGQQVRIYSAMYNHRLRGLAEARIGRLAPCGEAGVNGERRFHALAPIIQSPFTLPLGSSFKAEILLGRKPVYRIILEQ